jgi:hypothetical protein
MRQNVLPPCINILSAITQEIDSIQDIVSSGSVSFQTFRGAIKQPNSFNAYDPFLKSEINIAYVQILSLLVLSMHGGIFVPAIKIFSYKNRKVNITWDSGVRDSFIFGKFDDDFLNYFQYVQKKVFAKPKATKAIQPSIIKIINQTVLSYIDILVNTDKRIAMLITDKHKLASLLSETLNKDLLFILMSALPQDQLNALFLHIYQFLPEDLSIKSKDGHKLSISTIFQTPSSDTHYLLEKVMAYFELYYAGNFPILQHITQSKTKSFLVDLVKNDKVYGQLNENLKSLQKNQVQIRLTTYNFFLKHLDNILK